MDTDVVLLLTNAVLAAALGAGILFFTAKGLPLATETVSEFKRLVLELVPVMRRLFDPDTALSKALQAKGVDPAIADKLAEYGADVLTMLVNAAPETK